MIKKILILLMGVVMFSLMICGVSATLVDSEDFESYVVGDLLSNQSSEWACRAGYTTPSCQFVIGSPSTTLGSHKIESASGNKFLRYWALGTALPVSSNIMFFSIKWNNTDSGTINSYGDAWYTQSARMRVFVYDDDAVNGSDNQYAYAGVTDANSQFISNNIVVGSEEVCGEGNCQQRIAYHTRGRPNFPLRDATFDFIPTNTNTNCTLADGGWHNIDLQMHMNISLLQIDRVKMYQDGQLCYESDTPIASTVLGTSSFFQMLEVFATGAYTMDIDDIELYANQTVITIPDSNVTTVRITEGESGFSGSLDIFGDFGYDVAGIGDIDNDGVEDIVVTNARHDYVGGSDIGSIWVILLNSDGTVKSDVQIGDNLSGLPSGAIKDDFNSDWFGAGVDGIGDFDGDTIEDIAVCEQYDNFSSATGSLWLLYLNTDGTVKGYVKNSLNDLNVNTSSPDIYCQDVVSIGDLDGDGNTDFAIGVMNDETTQDEGGVIIAFMNANGTFKDHTYITTNKGGFSGTLVVNEIFGKRIGNIGDLDGDGNTDIVVGSPSTGALNGSVWILFLDSDGTVKSDYNIGSASPIGAWLGSVTAQNLSKQFGHAIASDVGDLNGDGILDIVVGAKHVTEQFFVIYLNTDGSVKGFLRVNDGLSPYYPDFEGDAIELPSGIDMIPDINGDGFNDFVIGASDDVVGSLSKGSVYILFGANVTDNVTGTVECSDFIDNDGDGVTDYPNDPACSSALDDSESPVNLFQCNDGVDNDLDTFTDYPSDPSCTSAIDDDEAPADGTSQADDVCLEGLFCLIYDTIPYSDNPFLHSWNPLQASDTGITTYLGGFSINLDTFDEDTATLETVVISKNISHTNTYNNLEGDFAISFRTIDGLNNVVNEEVQIGFGDINGNNVAKLLLNVTADPNVASYDYDVDIYAYDGDHWVFSSTAHVNDLDNGWLRIYFVLNELDNTYTISYDDSDGTTTDSIEYDYESNNQVFSMFMTNTINSEDIEVLLHVVELNGVLSGVDDDELQSVCDEFSLPFHLVESFNGFASDCGWNVDPDLWSAGFLNIQNEYSSYQLYKIFHLNPDDAIYYDRSRYSTVTFNLTIYDDSDTVNTMSLFLYDLAFSNAWGRFYYQSNGVIKSSEHGQTVTLTSSMPKNVVVPHMIVVDLVEDTYDYYMNGSLIASGMDYHDRFLNVEYFNGIYFQSALSHWALDDVVVFESDDEGEEQINSIENPLITPDADRSMCELFYTPNMNCNSDSDCVTDMCQPNGKCSHFDYTYCDDNAHTRGNMCLLSGMTSCVLETGGNLILDNFWMFLVLLIFLMLGVYLVLMFRGK